MCEVRSMTKLALLVIQTEVGTEGAVDLWHCFQLLCMVGSAYHYLPSIAFCWSLEPRCHSPLVIVSPSDTYKNHRGWRWPPSFAALNVAAAGSCGAEPCGAEPYVSLYLTTRNLCADYAHLWNGFKRISDFSDHE